MANKTMKQLNLTSDIYKHHTSGDLRMDRHFNGQAGCSPFLNIDISLFKFDLKKKEDNKL